MEPVAVKSAVPKEESTSPWVYNNKLGTNTINDADVLFDFAQWRNSFLAYLPKHDHAALFTGFDLATPTATNPIGMGYLNSICHPRWAVSEIEESYSAISVHIAAHELGHNLGSRHDGDGNTCPSADLYLMAPRLAVLNTQNTNPWTFSSCSQNAIKIFLSTLASDCLEDVPASSSLEENVYPGVKYSVDYQCNMTYGNDAVLCREQFHSQSESICYAMSCKRKGESSCTGKFFPFDGTPCGDKKWCVSGQCVHSDEAPALEENCIFGDDPNRDCKLETSCSGQKQLFCCQTCQRKTTSTSYSSTSTAYSLTTTTTTLSQTASSPSSTTSINQSTYTSTQSSSAVTSTFSSTSPTTSKPESSLSPTSTTPSTSSTTSSSTTSAYQSTSSETSAIPSTSSTTSTTKSPLSTSALSSTSSTTSSAEYSSSTFSTTKSTSSHSSTQESTSSLSSTVEPTSPTTTTAQSTSSTLPTTMSTAAQEQTSPPEEPSSELSFDVQTMVSLFLSAALVI